MIVTAAKYYKNGTLDKNISITATIGGVEYSVPIDESNSHYQAIQEWAKTNTIEEAD